MSCLQNKPPFFPTILEIVHAVLPYRREKIFSSETKRNEWVCIFISGKYTTFLKDFYNVFLKSAHTCDLLQSCFSGIII